MKNTVTLRDITIHSVVEQQGSWFDALQFFPTLNKEVLEEGEANLRRSCKWPVGAVRAELCHKDPAAKYPGRFMRRQPQAACGAAVLGHDEQ